MSKEQKRLAIIKAARDCFERYGFHKTTLDDIGKLVGLNKASLYYYFPNKEALLLQAALDESQQYVAQFQEKAALKTSAAEAALAYIKERVRMYKDMIIRHNLSLEELHRSLPRFEELYQDCFDREIEFMAQLLAKGQEQGEFRDADSNRVASGLLIAVSGIERHYSKRPSLKSLKDIDFTRMEEDVVLVASIILEGLKKK